MPSWSSSCSRRPCSSRSADSGLTSARPWRRRPPPELLWTRRSVPHARPFGRRGARRFRGARGCLRLAQAD
eukprot:4644299-Alexandrium_andersonii.AAC.1